MNAIVITLAFVAAFLIATQRGVGAVFAFLYLPMLLLLSTIQAIKIDPLPDIDGTVAIVLGGWLGALVTGKLPTIRPHWIDALVLACSFTMLCTAGLNGNTWTVVSTTGTEVLHWLMPYAMARAVFREPKLRRYLALSLSYLAMFLGSFGLVEWRLFPLFTSRILEAFGLSTTYNVMVLGRYGFFRAMVTADHPIDYGNVGFLLAALIVAMAMSGGVPLRSKRILAGIAASLACVMFSMSFSSIAGLAVATLLFLTLRFVRGSELLLVPGVVAAIVSGFVITERLLAVDLDTLPRPTASDAAIDGSFYVRVLIVQNSWNRVAKDAGIFGFGDQLISKKDLGLDSVDNSYMLFLIKRGWIHLSLRLLLAVSIAALGTGMLRNARGGTARTPPAALTAVLLATFASMYTVWFGFVYAELWTAMLAFAVTMRQVIAERDSAAVSSSLASSSGYASMPDRRFTPAGTLTAGRV